MGKGTSYQLKKSSTLHHCDPIFNLITHILIPKSPHLLLSGSSQHGWHNSMSICLPPMWPGACFSKVPKLFGRISGVILFLSSKRRRIEARNFAVILIFIPFPTYEKTSFTEKAGRSFTNGFSGPKSTRDFRETGPWARFRPRHHI